MNFLFFLRWIHLKNNNGNGCIYALSWQKRWEVDIIEGIFYVCIVYRCSCLISTKMHWQSSLMNINSIHFFFGKEATLKILDKQKKNILMRKHHSKISNEKSRKNIAAVNEPIRVIFLSFIFFFLFLFFLFVFIFISSFSTTIESFKH